MLPQLEKAARILAKASKILTQELDLVAEHDAYLDVAALWAAVEEAVPRTAVAGAVAAVEALVPEDDGSAEAAMRAKLALRYNTVRPFLSLLGESDALDAAPAGRRILKAVRRLPALSRRRVKERPLLPREVDADLVPAMWRLAVFSGAKLPQGGGGPGRVRGVRAGAAAPCPESARRVRRPVEPVGRPAPGCWTARGGRRCARRCWRSCP